MFSLKSRKLIFCGVYLLYYYSANYLNIKKLNVYLIIKKSDSIYYYNIVNIYCLNDIILFINLLWYTSSIYAVILI